MPYRFLSRNDDGPEESDLPEFESDVIYAEMESLLANGKASDIMEVLLNYHAGLYSANELVEQLDKELGALYDRAEERLTEAYDRTEREEEEHF